MKLRNLIFFFRSEMLPEFRMLLTVTPYSTVALLTSVGRFLPI